MTASPLLLWMPSLYSTASQPTMAEALCPAVRRLWPGFPESMAAGKTLDGAFVPEDLPYGPREARAYLNDLDTYVANLEKSSDESGTLYAMQQDRQLEDRLRGEIDEVARLAPGTDVRWSRDDERIWRTRAQQMLIWFWRQQVTLSEVEGLVGKVNSLGDSLSEGYGAEDGGSALKLAEDGYSPSIDDMLADLLPEWRICLAAAAALCPGAVFFLEGEAAEQMQERFCFSPDPELAKAAGMPEGMLALSFEGDAAEILGDVLEEVKVVGRLRLAVPLLPETADGGLH